MPYRNRTHENDTELLKYIWSLKDQNKDFDIKQSILKKSFRYSIVSKSCNISLLEKKASNTQFQRERQVT